MFKILYDIFDHTFKAMMNYELDDVFFGNVTYMDVPTENSFFPVTRNTKKIEDVCIGNLVVKKIAGNHATCLLRENYRNVYDIIIESLV